MTLIRDFAVLAELSQMLQRLAGRRNAIAVAKLASRQSLTDADAAAIYAEHERMFPVPRDGRQLPDLDPNADRRAQPVRAPRRFPIP